jgi:hypothetical protein
VEPQFKTRLPSAVQQLVDELERFADLPIHVAVNPRPASPTDPNPEHLAAEVTERSATVLIRSRDAVPAYGVLHELLHVQRFWTESIPQVMPVLGDRAPSNQWQVTSDIENALEHIVIVPREAEYGFDPFPYWNETTRTNWSRYPWPNMTDPWARRKNCLLGALTDAFLVNDPDVKQLVERGLRGEGLLAEARRFTEKIRRVLGSKPHGIATVLRFLPIPFEEVGLVGFDVKNRGRFLVPLPRH